jgi:hypothetical protein
VICYDSSVFCCKYLNVIDENIDNLRCGVSYKISSAFFRLLQIEVGTYCRKHYKVPNSVSGVTMRERAQLVAQDWDNLSDHYVDGDRHGRRGTVK